MRSDRVLLASAAACMFTSPVVALAQASAPAPSSQVAAQSSAAPEVTVVPTEAARDAASRLMQLEEDTVVLKAQLKKLDAQTQLAQRQQTLRDLGDDASGSGLSIIATQSLGGTMSAVVSTSNGGEFDVHVGDVLPGGLRVVSIHPGAVVIAERGGHRSTLSVRASSKEPLRNVTLSGLPTGAIPPIPSVPMPPR